MLLSLNEIRKYGIQATDGDLGRAKDFLFDDRHWMIRYLVVDTGKWLPGRLVLISPTSITRLGGAQHRLQLDLSQERIKESPPIDSEKPVSRQREAELARYYSWPQYWGPQAAIDVPPPPAATTAVAEPVPRRKDSGDPNLRSVREVVNYKIEASDGAIGHVEDFVGDTEDWRIRYMVVDTRNWLPGKKVLVSPEWIDAVQWQDSKVHVVLNKNTIEHSPEFDPAAPINRQYETRLYDYYGHPKYWE